MPVFFVMSGFFTAMLWRRRGLGSILKQRFLRVFLPCMVGIWTICPLQDWAGGFVYTETPPEWPFEVEEETRVPTEVQEVERAESLPLAAKLGQRAVVEELLAGGDDVDTRDDWGATALHWAAVTSEEEIVRTLIEEGANLDAVSKEGYTMLMAASHGGNLSMVEQLLPLSQVDATVADTDEEEAGFTALMYSCKKGHESCARALIAAKANIEAALPSGKTALMLAQESGHAAVCALLDA